MPDAGHGLTRFHCLQTEMLLQGFYVMRAELPCHAFSEHLSNCH